LRPLLGVVDNTSLPDHSDPGYNRLGKVQPVISLIQQACSSTFHGSRDQSINEAMIGSKGGAQ